MGPGRTSTVHWCRKGRPRVARHKLHDTTDDQRQHDKDKVLRQTCLQETSADRNLNTHTKTKNVKTKNSARSFGKLSFKKLFQLLKKKRKTFCLIKDPDPHRHTHTRPRPHTTPTPTTTHPHRHLRPHTHTPTPTQPHTPTHSHARSRHAQEENVFLRVSCVVFFCHGLSLFFFHF